jgi:hypothetical protein
MLNKKWSITAILMILWASGDSQNTFPTSVKLRSNSLIKAAIRVVSQDDGTGGTKGSNNREYSGTFTRNGVKANPPGTVADPTKRRPVETIGDSDFHSHPSGTNGIMGWAQPPSNQDIRVANGNEYVFGMRNNTIYIYNQTGVIATIPISAIQ